MKKAVCQIVVLCFSFLISVSSIPLSFLFAKKADNITYINSATDFYKIGDNLNGHYIITSPEAILIDKPWIPIGTREKPFTGTLDGLGQTLYLNKGFDKEYLINEIDDGSLNLGLFGYNQGVIKHLKIFSSNIMNDDITDIINGVDGITNINCGIVSGINEGYITTCKVNCNTLTIKKSDIVYSIGGISGINNKQIQGCTFFGSFSIKSESNSNVGSISGLMNAGSIIKYCYGPDDVSYSFNSLDSINNYGLCAGLVKGGTITNICISNANIKYRDLGESSSLFLGSLFGTINAEESITLDCVYTNSKTEAYLDVIRYSFVANKIILNGNTFQCLNTLFKTKIINNRTTGDTKIFVPYDFEEYNHDNCVFSNNYYCDIDTTGSVHTYNIEKINFEETSTSMLGFDDAIWKKGENTYYLEYENRNW